MNWFGTPDVYVKTGDTCKVSGAYAYKGNPSGKIPCYPDYRDRTLFLDKGDVVPPVISCGNHEGEWKLIGSIED